MYVHTLCRGPVVAWTLYVNVSLTVAIVMEDEDVEARVLRLLERQEDIEYHKRLENRRHGSLQSEFDLLSSLLQESLSRVESLDSEIEAHRRKIFEQQKYKNAVETLCLEECAKGKRLKETIETMIQHQKEQKEVLQEFYEYLLVKKRVPKKDLDDIVVCLGDPHKEMEEATRCKVTK